MNKIRNVLMGCFAWLTTPQPSQRERDIARAYELRRQAGVIWTDMRTRHTTDVDYHQMERERRRLLDEASRLGFKHHVSELIALAY
jgi:hypothetical protein